MVAASVSAVAQVSAPANWRSLTRIARSAPSSRQRTSAARAWGGPMLTAVISMSGFAALSRTAWSRAYSQKGLRMEATPSRIKVPVSGLTRTLVISGTCLTQTTSFMVKGFRGPGFKVRVSISVRFFSV